MPSTPQDAYLEAVFGLKTLDYPANESRGGTDQSSIETSSEDQGQPLDQAPPDQQLGNQDQPQQVTVTVITTYSSNVRYWIQDLSTGDGNEVPWGSGRPLIDGEVHGPKDALTLACTALSSAAGGLSAAICYRRDSADSSDPTSWDRRELRDGVTEDLETIRGPLQGQPPSGGGSTDGNQDQGNTDLGNTDQGSTDQGNTNLGSTDLGSTDLQIQCPPDFPDCGKSKARVDCEIRAGQQYDICVAGPPRNAATQPTCKEEYSNAMEKCRRIDIPV